MKILVQDRASVRVMPSEIWVTRTGKTWSIIGCSYLSSYFAEYTTEERAKEVLKEMFQYLRSGKKTYIMPEI